MFRFSVIFLTSHISVSFLFLIPNLDIFTKRLKFYRKIVLGEDHRHSPPSFDSDSNSLAAS